MHQRVKCPFTLFGLCVDLQQQTPQVSLNRSLSLVTSEVLVISHQGWIFLQGNHIKVTLRP